MIARLFLNHPKTANESYGAHAVFAGRFAFTLLCAAAAALIHAVVPALFDSTASRIVKDLNRRLEQRH